MEDFNKGHFSSNYALHTLTRRRRSSNAFGKLNLRTTRACCNARFCLMVLGKNASNNETKQKTAGEKSTTAHRNFRLFRLRIVAQSWRLKGPVGFLRQKSDAVRTFIGRLRTRVLASLTHTHTYPILGGRNFRKLRNSSLASVHV